MMVIDSATWIYNTLTADPVVAGKVGSRVYRDSSPEGTEFPFVAYQLVDDVPVTNAFSDILMHAERWQIKVVDKGSDYADIEDVAVQIISLFHKETSSGVIGSTFELYFTRSEVDNGVVFKTGILEFRIFTQ